MRSYEIMIILDPEVDDRRVTQLVESHLKAAQKAGAKVTSLEVMGRRRFAYDIKKKSEGTYVVITLEAEPAVVKELDRRLTIDEQVLRTKVFRPEPPKAKDLKQAARAAEKAARSAAAPRPEKPAAPRERDRGDRAERSASSRSGARPPRQRSDAKR